MSTRSGESEASKGYDELCALGCEAACENARVVVNVTGLPPPSAVDAKETLSLSNLNLTPCNV